MAAGKDIVEDRLKQKAVALLSHAKDNGTTFEIDFSESERPAAVRLSQMMGVLQGVIVEKILNKAPTPPNLAEVEIHHNKGGRTFLRGGSALLQTYYALAATSPWNGLPEYTAQIAPGIHFLS